jgi:hypothetical protein
MCTEWFGCFKDYSWTGCRRTFPSRTNSQWCYTTKSKGKMICSEVDAGDVLVHVVLNQQTIFVILFKYLYG